MSILLFAESQEGKLKKGSAELCSYGFTLAQQQNTSLIIVTVNCENADQIAQYGACLLYTSPSPRDATLSRMPSSA